jgi:hypothetical protein
MKSSAIKLIVEACHQMIIYFIFYYIIIIITYFFFIFVFNYFLSYLILSYIYY